MRLVERTKFKCYKNNNLLYGITIKTKLKRLTIYYLL